MALVDPALPYGLRDIKVVAYTTAAATTLGSTLVDLPNGQTMSFTEKEEFQQLRGDDKVVTTKGKGPSIDWDLESGGLSIPAYAIIAGGTITDSGVTPNIKRTYRKRESASRPFFRAYGQSISDSGGDLHVVIFRARATGDIKGELKDGEFMVPAISGEGFGSVVPAEIDPVEGGTVYEFQHNETVAAITVAG